MTLLCVDGSNAVHRAYYAVPALSHNGFPTNAVVGFFSILAKALRETAANDLVIVFDHPFGTNFRKEIYAEYKAGRDKKPEVTRSLAQQIPVIVKLCRALGYSIICKRDKEADDIIGSIAAQYEDGPCHILSGDKDFAQLLSKSVKIINPNKGITVTRKNCKDVYGIEPKRVIDYLMLDGDSIDNIQGIDGIGHKTAVALIEKYGRAEDIPVEAMPKWARENAAEVKRRLKLNRKLVTIRTDMYRIGDIELSIGKPNKEKALAICSRYGMTRLTAQFSKL